MTKQQELFFHVYFVKYDFFMVLVNIALFTICS